MFGSAKAYQGLLHRLKHSHPSPFPHRCACTCSKIPSCTCVRTALSMNRKRCSPIYSCKRVTPQNGHWRVLNGSNDCHRKHERASVSIVSCRNYPYSLQTGLLYFTVDCDVSRLLADPLSTELCEANYRPNECSGRKDEKSRWDTAKRIHLSNLRVN